jgi:hypothetical protein
MFGIRWALLVHTNHKAVPLLRFQTDFTILCVFDVIIFFFNFNIFIFYSFISGQPLRLPKNRNLLLLPRSPMLPLLLWLVPLRRHQMLTVQRLRRRSPLHWIGQPLSVRQLRSPSPLNTWAGRIPFQGIGIGVHLIHLPPNRKRRPNISNCRNHQSPPQDRRLLIYH